MVALPPDFSEFVALLAEHEVRYLVVGGYAVAFHGHPRFTGDLDVWLACSDENAARVLAALHAFEFGGLGLTAETFTTPDQVVQLGYPPNRLDLLTGLEGVTFDACYPDRETLVVEDVEVPFIGLDALRTNKRALGRHQDLADLEKLGG